MLETINKVEIQGRFVNIKYIGEDGETHYYSSIKVTKVRILTNR